MSAQAVQARFPTGRRAAVMAGVAEAVCVAGLGWVAGLLVWTLLAPESVAPVGADSAFSAPSAAARPAPDRSVLWLTNPFAPSGAVQLAGEEIAPETSLNLELFGVASGVGDVPGSAVIRTPDNRQHAFREGETIIDGVTLDRVLPDRVLIRRDGAAETLFLPGVARARASQPVATETAPAAPAGAALTADALYDALQVETHMRDGRMIGLRLTRAVDPEVVAQAGLAEGDILLEIDGQRLAGVSDFSGLFEGLRDATSAAIVVDRAGIQTPLTVTFGTPQ